MGREILESCNGLTAKQNLITNAIKFTRLEEIREISVSLGISLEQPTHSFSVPFSRTSDASEAATLQADWEKGEIVSPFIEQTCARGYC